MIHLLPSLDPSRWETHAVFRETFLCLRLSEAAAEGTRTRARSLYFDTLQRPEALGWIAAQPLQWALMAQARDLRQQEGFLKVLGSGGELDTRTRHRAQIARHVANSLSRLATTLEVASR